MRNMTPDASLSLVTDLVERKLGHRFTLKDQGVDKMGEPWHRYATGKIPALPTTCGVFAAFVKEIEVNVLTKDCDPKDGTDFASVIINLRRHDREGGSNGDTMTLFWHYPTELLLTRDEANEIYWKSRK